MFEQLTLGALWQDRVRLSADAPFLDFVDPAEPDTNRALTYADTAGLVDAQAALLTECGVRADDRVVIHMRNTVEMIVTLLAVQQLDAIAVPTIIQYSPPELAYVIGHCGARVVVTDDPHQDVVLRALQELDRRPVVVNGGAKVADGEEPVDLREHLPSGHRPGDRIAMMMYTSGTTADPKGVMLSHRACLSAGYDNAAALRLRPDDVLYCVLPLFHVNAMAFQLLPCLMSGSSMVLSPVFSVRAYWRVIREHGVTVGNLTNGPVRLLLDAEPDPLDREHRMRLMCYALPLEEQEIAAFRERFGAEMSMGWGLTETLACGTRTPTLIEPRHTWQSIGMVNSGWELKVTDDDRNELPLGEVGEAAVRGPGLVSGYFRDPDATAKALVDGWFYTGDLVRVDEQGYVFFEDRKKDVIKVKGENVAAGEVERVVKKAPGVRDCAVIGLPDRILGERLVAVVEADDPPTSEELAAWCADRLARFKVPSEFRFVDQLPRTSIGKIRKHELKELVSRP